MADHERQNEGLYEGHPAAFPDGSADPSVHIMINVKGWYDNCDGLYRSADIQEDEPAWLIGKGYSAKSNPSLYGC